MKTVPSSASDSITVCFLSYFDMQHMLIIFSFCKTIFNLHGALNQQFILVLQQTFLSEMTFF